MDKITAKFYFGLMIFILIMTTISPKSELFIYSAAIIALLISILAVLYDIRLDGLSKYKKKHYEE